MNTKIIRQTNNRGSMIRSVMLVKEATKRVKQFLYDGETVSKVHLIWEQMSPSDLTIYPLFHYKVSHGTTIL